MPSASLDSDQGVAFANVAMANATFRPRSSLSPNAFDATMTSMSARATTGFLPVMIGWPLAIHNNVAGLDDGSIPVP